MMQVKIPFPSSRIIPVLLALSTACSPGPSTTTPEEDKEQRLKTVSTQDGDDRVEYSVNAKNGKKEGAYLRWGKNGKLKESAHYGNDLLDGRRILFYEKGDTQIVETYLTGKFNGWYVLYYPNGKVRTRGQYKNDHMEGIWKTYYAHGALREEVTFMDNLENGPFREYYPDGKTLEVEGSYRNGDKEHGTLKFYDSKGIHVKTMECENGICQTVWKKAI
jgi:antitoxin component YwqK of YwqJK toxin-antitoxin module